MLPALEYFVEGMGNFGFQGFGIYKGWVGGFVS